MIKIENVAQEFRTGFWLKKAKVLQNISFDIPKHSLFGLLGPNGAGKSTLIYALIGLRRPTSGQILIDKIPSYEIKAKTKIGYLPERPYFHEHLTGGELLKYMGTLSGLSPTEIKSRTPIVLEQVQMSHARDLQLKKYSKGMLQRIGIAQAILHDPDFLVLDEPMSGLDPVGRKEIRDLLMQLHAQKKTILFSTHILSDAETLCDRIAIIKKGKLVGAGTIDSFLKMDKSGYEIQAFNLTSEQKLWLKAQREFDLGGGQTHSPESMTTLIKTIPDQDPQTALKKLLEQKIQVMSYNPIQGSLEALF
jgi:ABC-2 type transport system ATP-binding protein